MKTFYCKQYACAGITPETCLTRQQARHQGKKTLKYTICQDCEQGQKIKSLHPEWERKLKTYEVKNRISLGTFACPKNRSETTAQKKIKAKVKRMPKNTNPFYPRYDPLKARKLSRAENGILNRLESIGEAEIIAGGL